MPQNDRNMKIHRLFCILTLTMLSPLFVQAQEGLSYGFKVGLNFSRLDGDLEKDASGNSFEDFQSTTGFHVGAGVLYFFTERYGVKADLLFSQKGTQQSFDGEGVQLFYSTDGTPTLLTGTHNNFLRVTNSYIEIPISGFAKFGKIEFFGGPYVSFLVGSRAVGGFEFTHDAGGPNPVVIDAEYDFNYFKDDVPNLDARQPPFADNFIEFSSSGQDLLYPLSAGAYHDFQAKDKSFFKGIDLGLTAGLAFYINRGLYLSGNINYGLTDLSRPFYDHSFINANGAQYGDRDDVDRNLTWQIGIGFVL